MAALLGCPYGGPCQRCRLCSLRPMHGWAQRAKSSWTSRSASERRLLTSFRVRAAGIAVTLTLRGATFGRANLPWGVRARRFDVCQQQPMWIHDMTAPDRYAEPRRGRSSQRWCRARRPQLWQGVRPQCHGRSCRSIQSAGRCEFSTFVSVPSRCCITLGKKGASAC